ncbi:MAG TPA: hypothetical protein VFT74_15720 [Isosphaeraceae bacterium]|nr:hypothetical protein [Isosphaeraceae bacterium]
MMMNNREWIAAEFSKGIEAEHRLSTEARARAENPPHPSLAVLYNQIADEDERHRAVIETIATRYGHTPSRSAGGGLGETLSRLTDKVTEMNSNAMQLVSGDLAARANAIHWTAAWVHAFEEIGDGESARELASLLTEEKAHQDALQEALNRFVAEGARTGTLETAR